MQIRQGDVYWVDLGIASGSPPAGLRPCVVIQGDAFNQSGIGSTIVCSITTSSVHAEAPGNVKLAPGEAGLKRASVVNVSQLTTLDKSDLLQKVGRLEANRIDAIRAGVALVIARSKWM